MREILFRGKPISNEHKWVYGDLIHYESGETAILDKFSAYGYEATEIYRRDRVIPETVGQYTGKTIGKEKLFEGDIVEAVLPQTTAQMGFVWPIMPVVFRDAVFGLLDYRDDVTPFRSFSPRVTFEVKGNIYDNPELLKEET